MRPVSRQVATPATYSSHCSNSPGPYCSMMDNTSSTLRAACFQLLASSSRSLPQTYAPGWFMRASTCTPPGSLLTKLPDSLKPTSFSISTIAPADWCFRAYLASQPSSLFDRFHFARKLGSRGRKVGSWQGLKNKPDCEQMPKNKSTWTNDASPHAQVRESRLGKIFIVKILPWKDCGTKGGE